MLCPRTRTSANVGAMALWERAVVPEIGFAHFVLAIKTARGPRDQGITRGGSPPSFSLACTALTQTQGLTVQNTRILSCELTDEFLVPTKYWTKNFNTANVKTSFLCLGSTSLTENLGTFWETTRFGRWRTVLNFKGACKKVRAPAGVHRFDSYGLFAPSGSSGSAWLNCARADPEEVDKGLGSRNGTKVLGSSISNLRGKCRCCATSYTIRKVRRREDGHGKRLARINTEVQQEFGTDGWVDGVRSCDQSRDDQLPCLTAVSIFKGCTCCRRKDFLECRSRCSLAHWRRYAGVASGDRLELDICLSSSRIIFQVIIWLVRGARTDREYCPMEGLHNDLVPAPNQEPTVSGQSRERVGDCSSRTSALSYLGRLSEPRGHASPRRIHRILDFGAVWKAWGQEKGLGSTCRIVTWGGDHHGTEVMKYSSAPYRSAGSASPTDSLRDIDARIMQSTTGRGLRGGRDANEANVRAVELPRPNVGFLGDEEPITVLSSLAGRDLETLYGDMIQMLAPG
ncbi:hypothetical protein BU15DRAFT_64342 [Melanogaster broomeanus]|nr:hypothetical protein BU15DRAFT_64342 [Melanogaster broomeanus]